MARFKKFNLDLKVDSKGYNFLCAIYACEFVKIRNSRTLIAREHLLIYSIRFVFI